MKFINLKQCKNLILWMNLLVSKFRFLEFRLLLSRVTTYLQFVTTNCLIEHPYENTGLIIKYELYEHWSLEL